ncbi:ankyrin repeat and SAM domain-containing protein 1A-like isoform X2 [Limulus polyphemus]|uniref:Ankyrin repeat and SAM domain-containing protein 1A-like isoform X2 n=1 Tax=Limulus polyphemus TaxID=6850 RepID=A0ABM1B0H5_LIMPO|nr:ankyrin repeat and SAM domain-containing protein 1A-like isoform X2 [Limulus polyphemus]
MGKEQELLEAARNGNLSVVERILNQRARKSGPLASLRRGPGANTQDPSGYTSLHHSALNGHKDIVSLLLTHEASTNVVDNKGSTPLHLAAWTGNTEIVKLLLVHGPSVPNVNHTNHDHETALHSAAQYGHTDVVSLLLQNNCDPTVRNFKEETALDLAAQYGRLETVEQLVKHSPQLLRNNIKKHSPLHLASRNGHKQVVKTLLDAGFDFNFLTEGGSALHEAAFYGKNEVVKHLLDYGVDVNLQDQHGRTVFDLLEDLNTNIAKKTLKIVKDHVTLVATDDEVTESPCSLSPPPGFLSGTYANVLLPERLSSHCVTSLQQSSSPVSDINFYEVPPPPRSFSSSKRSSGPTDCYQTPPFCKSHDSSLDQTPSSSSRSPSIYETPPPPREIDILPVSSAYQLTPKPWMQSSRISRSSDSEAVLYEVPPPGKRFSDPTEQNSTLQVARQDSSGASSSRSSSTSSYIPMTSQQPSTGKPQPPAKPPRRSIVTISPGSRPQSARPGSSYEYLSFATNISDQVSPVWTGETSRVDSGKDQVVKRAGGSEEYVDLKLRNKVIGNYEKRDVVSTNSDDKQVLVEEESGRTEKYLNGNAVPLVKDYETDFTEMSFSALYDDIASGKVTTFGTIRASSKSTTALPQNMMPTSSDDALNREDNMSAKPSFLDFRNKRATVHIPLSPTNYHQPPTPDFPPPSPATAEYGILEKIRPLSQEYQVNKRASRDIATLTDDDEIFATVDSRGNIQVTLKTHHQSVSTDNIEEVIDDDPFAGLCRGSVCPENSSADFKISFHVRSPKGPSPPSRKPPIPRKPRNIYENIGIQMESIEKSNVVSESSTDGKFDNQNSLSVMSPFDENAEWAEIANIMASFGSGIAQESVFTSEMEEHFTNVLSLDKKASEIKKFKTVEEWLIYLGLSHYENLLINNGFDDMEFMGGNIVEDEDLKNIGISNKEQREEILDYCKKLRPIQPIVKDEEKIRMPESVKQWLKSLHLEMYYDTLQKNGYTDMKKVLNISEVELNTVLEINKLGHQKRIMASLGERSSEQYIGELEDFDLLKLNKNLGDIVMEETPSADTIKDTGLFKDFNKAISTRKQNKCSQLLELSNGSRGELKIRPPTQLMSEPGTKGAHSPQQQLSRIPGYLTTQWRHRPDVLIKGNCSYKALYLGSTLVKELKGLESTRKSIQKLKLSTRGIVKAPNVLLSISYTGVKFIDGRSKQKVCEHEIQNIHCTCQDAEDLTHFAYITKEHQTNFHYCHVFCAESMDLATEVILTLGQAFEVAYQMALRDKTKTAQKCERALNKCHDRKLAEKDRKSEPPPADKNLVQQGEKEHKIVSEKTT